jgi:hypothetical protein
MNPIPEGHVTVIPGARRGSGGRVGAMTLVNVLGVPHLRDVPRSGQDH